MTRAQRLAAAIGLRDNEAVIVYRPANIFYLTGFTGEGLALIGTKNGAIVTDFRYVEQAQRQCGGFEILSVEKGKTHENIAATLCGRWGVNTLYYEEDGLTVRTFRTAREALPSAEWKPMNDEIELLRQIKDAGEISLIEKACKITGESFERILSEIHEGITEKELAVKLEFDMLFHGADAAAFTTIVAAGANGSLPHAVPGDRPIRNGDMITMDFGANVDGYCTDMTRTVAVGKPSDKMRKIYDIVLHAQEAAQAAIAPGLKCCDIDAVARNIIAEEGYGECFGHSTGHGVGIDIHEEPRVSSRCDKLLVPGHIITIEPGIYVPGLGGVRIENTCAVTETGGRPLCGASKELRIL